MPFRALGHIADAFVASDKTATFLATGALLFSAVLLIEHLATKHQSGFWQATRVPLGAALAMTLVAVVAPAPALAQEPGAVPGLPDMISDPPFIWFEKTIVDPNGATRRVLAFDGFLHNIGEGSLDLFGNPQLEGGVKQRVFDGEDWETVSTPTVRFETDDGHNHFHLIGTADYALWDDARENQIDDASKIGFCLVDVTQQEERYELYYDLDRFNYCEQDNPGATELRMGITPGWTDIYDANTTLQWVDISNASPGRYWISALTDPNDEIVESDEENNALVFSRNRFNVAGHVARELDPQRPAEPITLLADTFGVAGALAFVVVDGPTNGRLDVPIGVDLVDATVEYTPDPGFVGTDSFAVYARDVDSAFPEVPKSIAVEVIVEDSGVVTDLESAPLGDVEIIGVEPLSSTGWASVERSLTLAGVNDSDTVEWFAADLPAGLSIDRQSGVLSGVPATAASSDAQIVALVDGNEVRSQISIEIALEPTPTMYDSNDLSSGTDEVLRLYLGTGQEGALYEASGLPDGTRVPENVPLVTGMPTEIGDFDIELRELIDGEVMQEFTFTWSVRPVAVPTFPL